MQFARHFGRSNVFQLGHHSERVQQKARDKGESGTKKTDVDEEVRGRVAFGRDVTFDELEERLAIGAKVRNTKLTKEFTFKDWQAKNGLDGDPAVRGGRGRGDAGGGGGQGGRRPRRGSRSCR